LGAEESALSEVGPQRNGAQSGLLEVASSCKERLTHAMNVASN